MLRAAGFRRVTSRPISRTEPAATKAGPPIAHDDTVDGKYDDVLKTFERDLFLKALERNRWSKTKTCREMGVSRNKLYRKLNELGIEL